MYESSLQAAVRDNATRPRWLLQVFANTLAASRVVEKRFRLEERGAWRCGRARAPSGTFHVPPGTLLSCYRRTARQNPRGL